jgi:hypothetical protein
MRVSNHYVFKKDSYDQVKVILTKLPRNINFHDTKAYSHKYNDATFCGENSRVLTCLYV